MDELELLAIVAGIIVLIIIFVWWAGLKKLEAERKALKGLRIGIKFIDPATNQRHPLFESMLMHELNRRYSVCIPVEEVCRDNRIHLFLTGTIKTSPYQWKDDNGHIHHGESYDVEYRCLDDKEFIVSRNGFNKRGYAEESMRDAAKRTVKEMASEITGTTLAALPQGQGPQLYSFENGQHPVLFPEAVDSQEKE